MQHTMNLHNEPFCKIKSGSKTVEMRLFDERRQNIAVGDTILFTNNATNAQLRVIVTTIETYANFDQLYQSHNKIAIGYAENEIANPSDMFKYYSAEQIATYGVVAIGIKLA